MPKKELPEKVYLATFGKPRFKQEIGKFIYGKKQMTYPKLVGKEGAIQECLEKGWIVDVSDSIKPTGEPGFHKRKYYRAKIDPIMTEIETQIDSTLKATTPDKKKTKSIIFKIIDSSAFRYWIEKNLPKKMTLLESDSLEFILSYLDILFILFDSNRSLIEKYAKINDLQDYESAIDQLRNNPEFEDKLTDLSYLFYGETDSPKEVKKDIPFLLLIPTIPLIEVCGFSNFGNLYYASKHLSENLSKILTK